MYEMEVAGVDFARLQAHLAERVVLPGDQGWDLARRAFTCCSTGALRRQLFALADAGFFVPVVVGPQFKQGHAGSSPVRKYIVRAHLMHHHVATEGFFSKVISLIASL